MTSTVATAAVFLSSAPGLSIVLKATLFLALGLTTAWLMRRQRASVRHLVLAATFATLLALPVLVLLGPAVSIGIPIGAEDGALATTNTAVSRGSLPTPASVDTNTVLTPSRSAGPSWSTLAVGIWFGGAAVLLIAVGVDLWRVRRIVRNGLPWIQLRQKVSSLAAKAGVRRAIDVLRHEDVAAPFMCGMWRPTIVLPGHAMDWSDEDLTRALVHELEHVQRVDWAVQCAARVTCACYWFHPLVWVAWRRLCVEAERACDDAVVQRAERSDYAEQLVLMAQRMSKANARPVLGMAHRSDLARRVAALLDATQRRGRAGTLAIASAICAAVLVGACIAPVRAVAVSPRRTGVVEAPAAAQTPSAAPATVTRPNRLDIALFEAAADGDIGAITTLLDAAGTNVNAAIDGDGSPLIGAAREGHLDAVRLLLDRGADVDMGVRGDGNALIMAAREGHIDVVTLLLDRGASIEHVVPGDENALIQASGSGHLEVVRLLVSRGANVNARVWAPRIRDSGEWRTPLSMARRNGHAPVVEFLQSVGASQ
jgi:beta-lactamase regulating signal transducer with metallopeptidase domain